MPGFPDQQKLPGLCKLMSIDLMMPSNHLILCHPLILVPSIFPSISVFSSELALHIRWSKYWSFNFNISLSSEYSGFISFRINWFDLLQSIGLSRNFSSTTVWKHQFFGAQPSLWSNSHIHTWLLEKTSKSLYWIFVGKVASLLFNTLSRFLIAFFPRSKHLLILWLQSPSTVILEPKKIKSATVSPSICHEVMGSDAKILVFWILSYKPKFSLSPFTFIKRPFSSSPSAITVVSSAYMRLLIFLPANLIPACTSSSISHHVLCAEVK